MLSKKNKSIDALVCPFTLRGGGGGCAAYKSGCNGIDISVISSSYSKALGVVSEYNGGRG
jgi:hypothetical protein